MPLLKVVHLQFEYTGEDPVKHQLIAGYLPNEAVEFMDLIEQLVNTELYADDKVKAMVRSMLEQSAVEKDLKRDMPDQVSLKTFYSLPKLKENLDPSSS